MLCAYLQPGLGVPALARSRCALLETQAEQSLVQISEQGLGMVAKYLRLQHACGFLGDLRTTAEQSPEYQHVRNTWYELNVLGGRICVFH